MVLRSDVYSQDVIWLQEKHVKYWRWILEHIGTFPLTHSVILDKSLTLCCFSCWKNKYKDASPKRMWESRECIFYSIFKKKKFTQRTESPKFSEYFVNLKSFRSSKRFKDVHFILVTLDISWHHQWMPGSPWSQVDKLLNIDIYKVYSLNLWSAVVLRLNWAQELH